MSASPALWAVICVHNKQVRDKESKSRVGLTFAWVRSIIQKRGLRKADHWLYWAGWNGDYILSSDLTALTWRSCIDPFLSSLAHVLKSYIVIKEVSVFRYCPHLSVLQLVSRDTALKKLSEIPVLWTVLWSPIHPVSHFEWGFERQVFTSKLFHFFCALLPFDPIGSCTILPFFSHRRPAFLPQHGGELIIMGDERR